MAITANTIIKEEDFENVPFINHDKPLYVIVGRGALKSYDRVGTIRGFRDWVNDQIGYWRAFLDKRPGAIGEILPPSIADLKKVVEELTAMLREFGSLRFTSDQIKHNIEHGHTILFQNLPFSARSPIARKFDASFLTEVNDIDVQSQWNDIEVLRSGESSDEKVFIAQQGENKLKDFKITALAYQLRTLGDYVTDLQPDLSKAIEAMLADYERGKSLADQNNADEARASLTALAEARAQYEEQTLALTSERVKIMEDLDQTRTELLDVKNMAMTFASSLEEKLKIDAGRDYWEKKARRHSQRSFWFAIVLGLYAAVLILVLSNRIYVLSITDFNLGTFGETRTTLIMACLLALGTILFWGARILTRILLGNIHLTNDCRERVVLIETYLALSKDSEMVLDERAIMLATIFRPSTDGVVRDDAAPSMSPASMISNMGSRSN